jgi:mevalonate kinase
MKMPESSSYYSNGNLLIAGEYFVLEGAKALAVPLKYGQVMRVDKHLNGNNTIQWSVDELSKPIFSVAFSSDKLDISGSVVDERSLRLQQILKALKGLNPGHFNGESSYSVRCNLEFSMNWGWGSSSSLLCNLASWTGTDPFKLNRLVSSGSGYDIAASASPTPLFFRIVDGKPRIEPALFSPPFKENIVFVYTGRKQNTRESIIRNRASVRKSRQLIPLINLISEKISTEKNRDEFMRHIAEHEKLLSGVLNIKTIKQQYFSDFDGEIKSLGAWGGDFVMVISSESNEYISKYFKKKGLDTMLRFDDIVRSGTSFLNSELSQKPNLFTQ